jgi:Tol biopolymer transport system component
MEISLITKWTRRKLILIIFLTFQVCWGCVNFPSTVPPKNMVTPSVTSTISSIHGNKISSTPKYTFTQIPTLSKSPSRTVTSTPRVTITPLPQPAEDTIGHIIVRWQRKEEPHEAILMMDGNGKNLQVIGLMSGTLAWSPSGRWIAAGCYNEDGVAREICILDANTIQKPSELISFSETNFAKTISRFSLPKNCLEFEKYYIGRDSYRGISSISWSKDETQLIVVCGTRGNDQAYEMHLQTCTLTLKGEASCWDSELGRRITNATWSPKDDLIVASTGPGIDSEVYLFNPDGSSPNHIADGWAPEWSPDGERIVFFRYENMGHDFSDTKGAGGISIINKDGTDEEWLKLFEWITEYDYPNMMFAGYINILSCWSQCRITWSPDSRYLAFHSHSTDCCQGAPELFRLDTNTGEIQILLNYWNTDENYNDSLADWGP